MKNKTALIALLLLFSICNIGKARLFVVDDLLKTVERSGRELATGKTRKNPLEKMLQESLQILKFRHMVIIMLMQNIL